LFLILSPLFLSFSPPFPILLLLNFRLSQPPFRPPDSESPALTLRTLPERGLCLAVPAKHPFARGEYVDAADLRGQRWIAGPASGEDTLMGVWPGLDERPDIAHTARDWLAKLQLVAAGCGITTVPYAVAGAVPSGVRILPVRGGPQELRRLVLARLPGPLAGTAAGPRAATGQPVTVMRGASAVTSSSPWSAQLSNLTVLCAVEAGGVISR